MAKGAKTGQNVAKGGSKAQKPGVTGEIQADFAPPARVSVAERAKKWPASRTELRDIASLRPYERNARTHSPDQIDQIARAIREWGWTNSVLVTPDGGIIAGHARVLAAERLGYDAVPCMVAADWSPEQVRAYVIADNKLAENAGWDRELLAAELADLESLGFGVDLIGFSTEELAALRPQADRYLTDPDDTPDAGPSPVSRAGDVWQLGPHRVLCGDGTCMDDVAKVMAGLFADCLWTDPPYNVEISKWDREGIAGDKQTAEDFAAFLVDAFVAGFAFLKPGSAIYVAHADTAGDGLAFRAAFQSAGFKLQGVLIWRKNTFVVGRSDYHWQHEPILYGWKPGASHRWFGDRRGSTLLELAERGTVFAVNSDGTIKVTVGGEVLLLEPAAGAPKGKALAELVRARPIEPTVLDCERPRRSEAHPTMKPVALIERMLRNSTRQGDLVLDMFGGSGSTLICCEMLGRQARLVELDARYVDVTVKRWQDFTGTPATLDGDGRTFDQLAAEHFNGSGRK